MSFQTLASRNLNLELNCYNIFKIEFYFRKNVSIIYNQKGKLCETFWKIYHIHRATHIVAFPPGSSPDTCGQNEIERGTKRGEMSERKGANCVSCVAKFPSRLRRGSFIPAPSEVLRIGSRIRARRNARNRAWNCAEARKVHARNGLTSAATSAMDRVQSARARAIRHSSFWLLPFSPDRERLRTTVRRDARSYRLFRTDRPVAFFFSQQ